ncbi:MAG: hypothetical protein KJ069_16375 [Anaerolineae bacterium]|nr:hypothetical protein [Anaerolineae bacterium]
MQSISDAIRLSTLRSKKEPEQYEKECREYLDQYRDYLMKLHNHKVILARLRSLQFAIQNSGRVPAEDIVVEFSFPDGFHFPAEEELFDLEHLKVPPKKPKRPELFESFANLFNSMGLSAWPHGMEHYAPAIKSEGSRSIRGPFIEPDNSTKITYEIDKILHNFIEVDLDPLEFFVADSVVSHTWELKCKLHAANLPEPLHGSLTLVIQLEG